MASISLTSILTPKTSPSLPYSNNNPSSSFISLHFQLKKTPTFSRISSPSSNFNKTHKIFSSPTKVMAVTDEQETFLSDQNVSVPVSPSDVLNMFFQAEGTMSDSAVPVVAKALEEAEGVSDLKVQVLEGIATVELTKQTTVQASGVASSLVEIIQGSGFKLHTLNLSFQDEEDLN